MATQAFWRYLKTQAGSSEMAVDGSGAPVEFSYTAPRPTVIHRLNFVARAAAKAQPNGFFSLAALAKGLWIVHRGLDGGVLENFGTGDRPIMTTIAFGALAGVDVVSDTAQGQSSYGIRWTLARAGAPLIMPPGTSLVVTVRDDIDALEEFAVMAQGVEHVRGP